MGTIPNALGNQNSLLTCFPDFRVFLICSTCSSFSFLTASVNHFTENIYIFIDFYRFYFLRMPLGQKKTKRQFKPKKKEAQVEAKIEPEPEFVVNEAADKKKKKGPPEKKPRMKPQRCVSLLHDL